MCIDDINLVLIKAPLVQSLLLIVMKIYHYRIEKIVSSCFLNHFQDFRFSFASSCKNQSKLLMMKPSIKVGKSKILFDLKAFRFTHTATATATISPNTVGVDEEWKIRMREVSSILGLCSGVEEEPGGGAGLGSAANRWGRSPLG